MLTDYEQMPIDLGDMRVKPTRRTTQVLDALSKATGRSQNQIAARWLDERAASEIHSSTLVYRLTKDEGTDAEFPGIDEGYAGDSTPRVGGNR